MDWRVCREGVDGPEQGARRERLGEEAVRPGCEGVALGGGFYEIEYLPEPQSDPLDRDLWGLGDGVGMYREGDLEPAE